MIKITVFLLAGLFVQSSFAAYTFTSNGGGITVVNTNTGAVESSLSNIDALSLVYGDGFLYAGVQSDIYKIDAQTGSTSFLSSENSYALAYPSSVPLPGAVWLFGSALLGLAFARRK